MKKHNLIIDGTQVLYSNLAVNKDDYTNKGDYIGGVTGTLRQISGFINKFTPDSVFVVFDIDKSKYRLKLYPQYKAGRHQALNDEMKERFDLRFLHITYLKLILSMLGCRVLTYPDVEADDIIANFVEQSGRNNTIISTDKDFAQLLSSTTRLYRPVKYKNDEFGDNQLVSYKNVDRILGYPHSYSILIKILSGDSSDNISGIDGIGIKTAVKIITDFKEKMHPETSELSYMFKDWLNYCKQYPSKHTSKIIKFIEDGNWERNDKLMNLKHGPKFKIDIPVIENDYYGVIEFLTELGFYDIMDEHLLEHILQPFENLT